MLVTLYTSRVILNALGVIDYGIHNVVGGVVLMMSFLNNSMASSTQRFLNFEMGRNNSTELKRVFSMSVNIHVIIAIVVFLLLETFGLWIVVTQLKIPTERMDAALWVFHFSVASLLITIISVPYYASIISNEKMTIFAFVGIAEAILKLLIAFYIQKTNADRLKVYAVLLFVVTCVVQLMYLIYARNNFPESRYNYFWNSKLFKKLISFASWNLFGSIAVVAKNQGVNVLLNVFFGPAINTARGIAIQVNSALTSFVTNFLTALRPQIIKSYASDDIDFHLKLTFNGARYSYFLLFILSLPVLLETETILKIWLKTVPDFTAIFVRLVIISALIDTLSSTLTASIQATGKIKKYQSIVGFLHLSIFPLSYLFFRLDYSPESTYYITIVVYLIILIARVGLVKKQIDFSIHNYFKSVVVKSFLVSIVSVAIPLVLMSFMNESFIRLLIIVTTSLIVTTGAIFLIGINNDERKVVKNIFLSKFGRKINEEY